MPDKRPKRLHPMGWIEPDYLNIKWKSNRLAEPSEELDWQGFSLLRDHGTYGLCGISFASTVSLPDTPKEQRIGFGGWTVHYYFYPLEAIAVVDKYVTYREYTSGKWEIGLGDFLPRSPHKSLNEFTYGYARRYYRIGCQHNWIELSQQESKAQGISHYGNCFHVRVCTNCGEVNSYDSSG